MIQIRETTIIEAAEKGTDEFLKVFTDAYLEALGGDITAENMDLLNGYQHTLLALRFFSEEVNEGGFVQLIQNGYGGYIFDNPVAKALKLMGATGLSKILYKAKEIYDAHREELERETTDEEFAAMYVDFEQFDELEEKFFYIEEEEIQLIAQYVDEHLEDFAGPPLIEITGTST
ncbi:MAG: DMP19 family protein [Proteiniphilum sp.]